MEAPKIYKGSDRDSKLQKPLPIPVTRVLEGLGANINRARRRRNLSQEQVAKRVGISVSTVKRMESGDPRMQIHVLARTLHLFGELASLGALLDSAKDDIGLALMDENLPERVRPQKKPSPRSF